MREASEKLMKQMMNQLQQGSHVIWIKTSAKKKKKVGGVVAPKQTLAHHQSFTSYILGPPIVGTCGNRIKRNESPPPRKLIYIILDSALPKVAISPSQIQSVCLLVQR